MTIVGRSGRSRRAIVVGAGLTFASIVAWAGPASATWSLVAVDEETGEVGVALASCVAADVLGDQDAVLVPAVLVPGVGAGVAQGIFNTDSPEALANLLRGGAEPEEVIGALLAEEFEDNPEVRQYGIVGLPGGGDGTRIGGAAGFTGDEAEDEAGSVTGDGVVVQGVLMSDSAVLASSLDAFERSVAAGETLARSLAAGLAAGSEAGGDRRCGDQTALFAHLAVARPGEDPFRPETLLTVTVDEGDGQNPVPLLPEALAEGRSGWVDRGLNRPTGVPRVVVMAVAAALAVAAVVVFRIGMGSPSARR